MLTAEEINKYKTIKEVVTPIHPVKEAGAIVQFEVWDIPGLIKATEQALLSKLQEQPDEEMVRIIAEEFIDDRVNPKAYPYPYDRANNILSSLSPILKARDLKARNEERERIKDKLTEYLKEHGGDSLSNAINSKDIWQALNS